MHRFFIYLLVLFCACRRAEISSEDNVAIYGVWAAGETPEINAWKVDGNSVEPAQSQQFELVFPDGEKALFQEEFGHYRLQSTRIPQPGEKLTLYWLLHQDTAIATVYLPQVPQILTQLEDTLDVSLNESVFIEWNVPNEAHECALRLECLESIQVPAGESPGNFIELFEGPQAQSELTLEGSAFTFLGRHRLTISALNDPLLDVFFFDPSDIRGLVNNGPDNVIGGKGFVGGTAKAEVYIFVE